MIIGISGKIGSGKDTVGKMIQYILTPKDSNEFSLGDYLNDKSSYLFRGNNYEFKKFADKIKNIVCFLLGCTKNQLENREFKEKELGEEWNKYVIENQYGTYYFDNYQEALESHGSHYEPKLIKLTPRKFMQLLGTEAGRDILHPNIWVNSLMSDYKEDSKWIITDVRFPNELKAVKDKEGITLRIVRPSSEHLSSSHISETALDRSDFDYTILNNGSLEDLFIQVNKFLEYFKIK